MKVEFTLKATFNCSPNELFEAWLDSEKHSDMTGGDATTGNAVGDTFSAWNGYITGKNLELEPGSRIVQAWRTSEFESDEPDATIEILLNEVNGQTEVTLTHHQTVDTGDKYVDGWEQHYFAPMREYFNS